MGRAKRTAGWGGGGYSANAVKGWLGKLNQGHRSLIVAESVDASTDRIVRCLAEIGVPINVATVQRFEDANGRGRTLRCAERAASTPGGEPA